MCRIFKILLSGLALLSTNALAVPNGSFDCSLLNEFLVGSTFIDGYNWCPVPAKVVNDFNPVTVRSLAESCESTRFGTKITMDQFAISGVLANCVWSTTDVHGLGLAHPYFVQPIYPIACLVNNLDGSGYLINASIIFGCGSKYYFNKIIIDPNCSSTTTDCQGAYLQTDADNQVKVTDSLPDLAKADVERTGVAADGVSRLVLRIGVDTTLVPFQSPPPAEPPLTLTYRLLKSDGSALSSDEIARCAYGSLQDRTQTQTHCDSVTVPGEGYFAPIGNGSLNAWQATAIAVYKAPNWSWQDFHDQTVQVEITAHFTAIGKDLVISHPAIKLTPPPTLIVHGLWGDGNSLQPLRDYLSGQGMSFCTSCVVDYYEVDNAAGSIDPFNSQDQRILDRFSRSLQNALDEYRQKGFAVSQVTVLGHSMGGLVARAYVARQEATQTYRSKANYNQGDIHKLITLGTPHQGSPLADLLVQRKCCGNTVERHDPRGGGAYCSRQVTLEQRLKQNSLPVGPAVQNLQTGSDALQHIGTTNVPSHVIAGIAPSTPWYVALDLASALDQVILGDFMFSFDEKISNAGTGPCDLISNEPIRLDRILGYAPVQGGFYNLSDSIVPFDSQRAFSFGIQPPGDIFCGVQHSKLLISIDGIMFNTWFGGSNPVQQRVASLLAASKDDPKLFGGIGPLPAGGKNNQLQECKAQVFDDYTGCPVAGSAPDYCASNGSIPAQSQLPSAQAASAPSPNLLMSIDPPEGAVVQPGTRVTFTFTVKDGQTTNGAVLVLKDGYRKIQRFAQKGLGPYRFDVPIPQDWAGEFLVYANTIGGSTENYSLDSAVSVKSATPPSLLGIIPSSVNLKKINETLPLQVRGYTATGFMDLTAASTGSTYAVGSKTANVVTVDANGIITAKGNGSDSIIASNNGKTATVPVTVQVNQSNQAPCLFNWAEKSYASLFAPTGSPTAVWSSYTYRYYSTSKAYLGVSSTDNHVYYLGQDGVLRDEGPLADWLPKAGCQPPPPPSVECLFNWAEKNYASLFAPAGSATAVWTVYTYRYYAATNAYLGVSSADNDVWYKGPDGVLLDAGPLSKWLPLAGCQ